MKTVFSGGGGKTPQVFVPEGGLVHGKTPDYARRGRFDSHTYFALVVYSKMAWLCVSYVRIDIQENWGEPGC